MDVEIASDDLAAFISLWKRRTRSWQGQRTREEEKVKRVGRIGETRPQTMKLYDDVPTKTSPGLGSKLRKYMNQLLMESGNARTRRKGMINLGMPSRPGVLYLSTVIEEYKVQGSQHLGSFHGRSQSRAANPLGSGPSAAGDRDSVEPIHCSPSPDFAIGNDPRP